MTARVKSRESKVIYLASGSDAISILSFSILVCSALLLFGCDSRQSTVPPRPPVSMPPDARKAELLNVLDRKFENPEAHFQLGQLYHAERDWTKAEYHYKVTLGFDPAHADAKASVVKLFIDSGDSAKSKTHADDYMIKASNSATQSLRLAMAFHRQQLDEYALDAYQQAFSLDPGSAEVNKEIGFYYLDKDDKVLAKEYLIRSFNINPNQPGVAGELGRLGVEVKIPGREGNVAEGSREAPRP